MQNSHKRETIRYARTDDGVNLAYISEGAGASVIVLPFHFSHIRYRWNSEPGWANGIVKRQHVVTYDSRGQGLSSRDLERPPSMEDYAADLETVWNAAGVEQAVLVAYGGFAHVALRYALAHPERVSALVLICASESFAAWPTLGMVAMARENWDLFIDLSTAKAEESFRGTLAAFMKACANSDDFVQLVQAFSDSNVSELLGAVRLPTLVLHSMDQHWLSPDEGIQFAARIPGARMVLLDGDSEPNVRLGVRAILEFLSEAGLPSAADCTAPPAPPLTERQLEILRLIIQGSTNREVATKLFVSERTVERHLGDIYSRLGVRNRSEAIAQALRRD